MRQHREPQWQHSPRHSQGHYPSRRETDDPPPRHRRTSGEKDRRRDALPIDEDADRDEMGKDWHHAIETEDGEPGDQHSPQRKDR